MNVHELAARRLAHNDSPVGHLCRGLLKLLDAAREDSIWAQAIAEYEAERVTLGGIPPGYHQPGAWGNTALPVGDVHTDYKGRL